MYVQSDGVRLTGYTDSDWVGSVVDKKSTSGCSFSLGSAIVSWFSQKQKSVTLSSTEAEYMVLIYVPLDKVFLRLSKSFGLGRWVQKCTFILGSL